MDQQVMGKSQTTRGIAMQLKQILSLSIFLSFGIFLEVAQAAIEVDSPLPAEAAQIELLNVDGQRIVLDQHLDTNGLLVVFSCNHCPWAKAWESRIVEAGNHLIDEEIGVVMVNPNDPALFPEDSFEKMKERAQVTGMRFPYAVDETSGLARAFDAARTPELFLFNGEGQLAYAGAFDDNSEFPDQVTEHYLMDAVDSLLAGRPVATPKTKSIGCSIKFRE